MKRQQYEEEGYMVHQGEQVQGSPSSKEIFQELNEEQLLSVQGAGDPPGHTSGQPKTHENGGSHSGTDEASTSTSLPPPNLPRIQVHTVNVDRAEHGHSPESVLDRFTTETCTRLVFPFTTPRRPQG